MTICHNNKRGEKMPKDTFFNLNQEKMKKIEVAIENEFARTSFDKFSINHIIKEANIPRGSFYQYFADKEDAIKHIMQKYILAERQIIEKFLEETKGDVFETSLKVYDYMTAKSKDDKRYQLYKNVMQELKKNNVNLFVEKNLAKEEEIQKLLTLIDTKILRVSSEDDLKNILKIISVITRTINLEVVKEKKTIQEGREELKKQLEILKWGMLK